MSSRFFKISRIRDVGSFGRNVFQLWQRRGRRQPANKKDFSMPPKFSVIYAENFDKKRRAAFQRPPFLFSGDYEAIRFRDENRN